MNRKTSSEYPRQVYELRVSIADIRPQIWRKLSVPGNYTLGHLHAILQTAFGWDNDHMHSFTVNSTVYGMMSTDFGFSEEDDVTDEDTVRLDDLHLQPKQKFSYLYDFGDSWEHNIMVSKIIPTGAEGGNLPLPRCLGGKRAGPPEDSGGSWGYADMVEVIKDPNNKNYEEIHEWTGDIDPEYFNLEEINAQLEQIFKPQPPKK
ncbi:MAG: plasmid pRiA4b ORF-3 family protein [Spirochaetaceae bacterium]|jgi:hypothetical protein|nr:plasmid pRiA4b ORF-3 family protein [Spirochaetaceae bacterium]